MRPKCTYTMQCVDVTQFPSWRAKEKTKRKKNNNNNFVNNLLIVSLQKLISPGKNSNSFVVQWNTRFTLSKSPCLWAMPFSVQCQIWVVLWCASESPGFYDNRLLYAVMGIQLDVLFAKGLWAMCSGKCRNGVHLYMRHGQMGAQCCLAAKRGCWEAVVLLSSLSFLWLITLVAQSWLLSLVSCCC